MPHRLAYVTLGPRHGLTTARESFRESTETRSGK